jgi:hypothetical protein
MGSARHRARGQFLRSASRQDGGTHSATRLS